MPFALLIVGIVLIVSGVKNTQSTLFSLVQGEFTGSPNFIFWFVSILIIGLIGYVKALKPISTGLLVLVVLVLFLTKGNPTSSSGGFFAKFTQALGTTNSTVPATIASNSMQQLQQQQTNLLQQLWPYVNGSDIPTGIN